MREENVKSWKRNMAGLLASLMLLIPVVSQFGSTAEAYYDETLEGVETQSDYFSKEETDSFGSTMDRINTLEFIQKQVFGTSNSENYSGFTGSSFSQGYSQFAVSNQETQIFETYEGASGQTSEEPAARFGAGTGFWIEETKNDKALVVFDSQNRYDDFSDVKGWTDAGALDLISTEKVTTYYSLPYPFQVQGDDSSEPDPLENNEIMNLVNSPDGSSPSQNDGDSSGQTDGGTAGQTDGGTKDKTDGGTNQQSGEPIDKEHLG